MKNAYKNTMPTLIRGFLAVVISASLLLLCGCSDGDNTDSGASVTTSVSSEISSDSDGSGVSSTASFSFDEVESRYAAETAGVKRSGFVNTVKNKVANAEEAEELAKKECTVEYDTVLVAYDGSNGIYCVSFYVGKAAVIGGDQQVYLSSDGITLLVVYGE